VALGEDPGFAAAAFLEGEERDLLAADELRGDGAADAVGELRRAHGDVLLDLHDAVAVVATLRLHRENVVRALAVDADVDLVGLDLADVADLGAQVALQRVARDAQEDVDQRNRETGDRPRFCGRRWRASRRAGRWRATPIS